MRSAARRVGGRRDVHRGECACAGNCVRSAPAAQTFAGEPSDAGTVAAMAGEPVLDARPSRSRRAHVALALGPVRLALALSITALLTAAALGATVSAEGRRAALEYEAQRLLALPYRAFEKAAAERSQPFDWSSDGCSQTPRVLAVRFAGPCRQHDFAYRNLGHGLRLRSTDNARAWADARFLDELRRRCGELFGGWRLARCRVSARAMWAAVRRLGPAWGRAGAADLGAANWIDGCVIVTGVGTHVGGGFLQS